MNCLLQNNFSISSFSSPSSKTNRSLALHDLTLSELSIRQDLSELKATAGVLIWKVTEFSRRREDALTGRVTSIYSQPFFTSPCGYKVCARLYPNGDGAGRGTHLSLFFVIMRGEFDALLLWPFQLKITLGLLDQSYTSPRHVFETFRPDVRSSSYQRPQQEMNVASGCPCFLPLSSVGGSYIKDDTAFFKIIVHTSMFSPPESY